MHIGKNIFCQNGHKGKKSLVVIMVKESSSLDILGTLSFETSQEWILKLKVLNPRKIIFVLFTIHGMYMIAQKSKHL